MLDESRDTFHDSLGSPRAAAEDHKIIGVSGKGVPAFLQLLIEIVEEDVRQQWTQGSALRHSGASGVKFARG